MWRLAIAMVLLGCNSGPSNEELCKQGAANWFQLPPARFKYGGGVDDDVGPEKMAKYVAENCTKEQATNRKLFACMKSAKQRKDCHPDLYE